MLFESVLLDIYKRLPSQRVLREKSATRELLSQKRRMLEKTELKDLSARIIFHVEQLPAFQTARTVLLYYPTSNEVDLLPLIKKYKKEKTFLFPVVHQSSMTACPYEGNAKMHRGKYNIPEPTTDPYQGDIDLVLVPGVGFDAKGHRLGRGGGYYDRFVQGLTHKSTLVGVGYDFQLIEAVPVNRRDKKMHYVITPSKGIIKAKRD
jgi:5-formyltetrahydrofolate cyclo-ligase